MSGPQSIIEATHKWLHDNSGRSIEVRFHCQGWRVTLREGHHEVGYGVRGTLNASLEEAFKLEPTVRESVERRLIGDLEDRIRRESDGVARMRRELSGLKRKHGRKSKKAR